MSANKSLPWFCLHADFLENPKMILLRRVERYHFFEVLAIKRRGLLDQAFDCVLQCDALMRHMMNVGARYLQKLKQRLMDARLIDEMWQPLGWIARQFPGSEQAHDVGDIIRASDASKERRKAAKSGAERTKEYRQRKKQDDGVTDFGPEENVTVTNCVTEENVTVTNFGKKNVTQNVTHGPKCDAEIVANSAHKTPSETGICDEICSLHIHKQEQEQEQRQKQKQKQKQDEGVMERGVQGGKPSAPENAEPLPPPLPAATAAPSPSQSAAPPAARPAALPPRTPDDPDGLPVQNPAAAPPHEPPAAAANAAPAENPQPPHARSDGKPRKAEGKKSKAAPALAEKPPDVDAQVWNDFLILRKSKKAPLTATALRGIASEAQQAGIALQQALQTCCEAGWQGFKADWYENRTRARAPQLAGNAGNPAPARQQYMSAAERRRQSSMLAIEELLKSDKTIEAEVIDITDIASAPQPPRGLQYGASI